MKTKFFLSCFFFFVAFTNGHSQKVFTININDEDCTYIVDGLIMSSSVDIPMDQLVHFEQAAGKEKLEKLGLAGSRCVMVKSSSDLAIESYIYRQVHEQVQQVGTKYKLPIAVNENLIPSYTERRNQLSELKAEDIKQIRFLNKAEAQDKYGDKVVFCLIEITV